jgi:hypothetical protein
MPNPIVGSVPRGEDYFGQETLIESIWNKLKTDNILLAAPRRFGKTAAMYKLYDEPRPGFVPVYTNLEHIAKASDFTVELISIIYQKHQFKRLIGKLWEGSKNIAAFFRSLPEDIDIGGFKVTIRENTDVSKHWLMYSERIMNLLSGEKPSLLLLLDEFAVMIDRISGKNREEAEQLLHWFRSARTAPETRTRFVIGGSIHLLPTLDAMKMVDTVNDLYVQPIKPFAPDAANAYLEGIFAAQQVALTHEVKETILRLVGEPIPYFLAVLSTAIFDYLRATDSDLDPGVVKTVFEEDLLGGSASATFYHYRSRIDTYYPGREGQAAKAILGLLSRAEANLDRQTLYQLFLHSSRMAPSTRSEEKFMYLMNKLDNDFYISFKKGKYSFFSRVLKMWWRNRYGFQGE